ncbi:uncharacterized protein LOC128982192, partial [Macrosteles quadrilineatus]|uniref:uncharacterized protein LOC128982192 n=1 Tax=Macrosteles quadrilineatus TaxID=74068 RepID=UPI0023E09E2D
KDIIWEILNASISDHTGQLCYLSFPAEHTQTNTSTRRHINAKNLHNLKLNLAEENWNAVFSSVTVDDAYNSFMQLLLENIDVTCPLKKSRRNHKPEMSAKYDHEARLLKQEFLDAQRKFLLTNCIQDKQEASKRKKAYDLKLRSLRREISASKINQAVNKSKAIWQTINCERNNRCDVSSNSVKLQIEGREVEDPVEVANLFNHYFATVAEETIRNNQNQETKKQDRSSRVSSTDKHNVVFPMHNLKPVSQTELLEVINSLKPKSSTGIDGISARIVKSCRQELLLPLLHVIQLSLTQERQHGFVKGKSTTTALIDFVESVIDDIDSGNNVVGIFVDMSKAFDCLSHDLIISKLSSLGVCGTALGWFTQYLKGRTQLVELSHSRNRTITTVRSEVRPVSRGVPQGSVLGPVLYILSTNDLPDTTEPFSKAIMYAYDTVLLSSNSPINNVEVNAYIGLSLAAEYCDNHDLVFNASKTKLVSFSNRKSFVCCIPDIDSVSSVRHLGVIIDEHLAWDEHIEALCHKLITAIFALRRTMAVSTEEAALTAYYALLESILCYGIVVWGGSSAQNLNRVLIMQKRAVRTLTGIETTDSCRPEFRRKTHFQGMILLGPAMAKKQIRHNRVVHIPTLQGDQAYRAGT